jgi:hypothetical protein
MIRRRSEPDPLFVTKEPTWLCVQDAVGRTLECVQLEPYANLRAILNAARDARIAEGWQADEIGRRCSFFFCTKDGVRLEVLIRRLDPAMHTLGHGHEPH